MGNDAPSSPATISMPGCRRDVLMADEIAGDEGMMSGTLGGAEWRLDYCRALLSMEGEQGILAAAERVQRESR